jgi:hypothetical protein
MKKEKPNLARDGAPKKLADCTVHGATHHFNQYGQMVTGLSRTQGEHPSIIPGAAIITSPNVEKKIGPAPIKPGMRRR